MDRMSCSLVSTGSQSGNEGSTDHDDVDHSADVLEKQRSDKMLSKSKSRNSNAQAVPGVPLDEADFDDSTERPEPEEDQEWPRQSEDGVSGAVHRALSRRSTKSSWRPGPPPDGGVKAWTAGQLSSGGRSFPQVVLADKFLLQLPRRTLCS